MSGLASGSAEQLLLGLQKGDLIMNLPRVFATLTLLLLAIAMPAAADEWSFNFESPGISLVGIIDTSNTLNSLGNFDVTGITGKLDGLPIGPLLANPNQPLPFFAPDGNFWDNNLSAAAPFVTPYGIGFDFFGDPV
jgi:hypothetical protein